MNVKLHLIEIIGAKGPYCVLLGGDNFDIKLGPSIKLADFLKLCSLDLRSYLSLMCNPLDKNKYSHYVVLDTKEKVDLFHSADSKGRRGIIFDFLGKERNYNEVLKHSKYLDNTFQKSR